jgi:hypothetical protein
MHKAFVNGYKLEVPEWWNNLSQAERDLMCNGMGLSWWPESVRFLIDHLTGFRAAADVHDVEWTHAARLLGTDKIGLEAYDYRIDLSNWRFRRNMLQITEQRGWRWWKNPVGYLRRRMRIRICYKAVLVGGMGAKRMARRIHDRKAA